VNWPRSAMCSYPPQAQLASTSMAAALRSTVAFAALLGVGGRPRVT
jgi:hypothetical protein